MIKSLAVECLLKEPKLNNLSDLLKIMLESQETHDVAAAARYLCKIFQTYLQNRLLSKDQSQTSAFIYKKLLSFGEIACMHFVNLPDNRQVFLECLEKAIIIDHRLNKQNVLKAFVQQLVGCKDDQIWQSIKNGDLLTHLIKNLKNHDKAYHAKVSALLNISQQLVFRQFFISITDKKRNRNDETSKEEDESEQTRVEFEKEYESLLIGVLKDKSVPEEYLRQIMKGLGENIYRNLKSPLILSEYVLDRFAASNDFEVKVHALAGLYILIGRHGLQVENFYNRLFSLLTQKIEGHTIFDNKKCKRVYKLIENALRSSKVPFNIVCNFVRVLLEQIFVQNTEFGCWAVALIFNIFKKHQNLLSCLDKSSVEAIPQSSHILNNIEILKVHFLPQIRSVLRQISKQMNRLDFLDIDTFSNIRMEKLLKQKQEEFVRSKLGLDVPEILHPLIL